MSFTVRINVINVRYELRQWTKTKFSAYAYWYNNNRLHLSLSYLMPMAFYKQLPFNFVVWKSIDIPLIKFIRMRTTLGKYLKFFNSLSKLIKYISSIFNTIIFFNILVNLVDIFTGNINDFNSIFNRHD